MDGNNKNDDDDEKSKLDVVKKQFQEKEKQRLQSKLEKREISNKEQIDQSSSNIASETLLLINNLSDDIESRLNEISNYHDVNDNKIEYLKESYNQMEESLSEINSITTMSSHILTSYDVKSILENIDSLKKQIDKSKEKYMPKQKLSLTRKKSTKTTTTKTSSSLPIIDQQSNDDIDKNNNTVDNDSNNNNKEPIFNLINIRGFKNKELFYPPSKDEEISSNDNNSINDLFISDLTDCTVILNMKVLTALKINNLKNCIIRAYAPIDGSIFIDNCTNSIFSLVSRQIRIHYCIDCQFNIFVKSNPIIEGSKQIKFSSYLQYLQLEKLHHLVDNQKFKEFSFHLDSENIDSNKWKLVNDFDWIQQKQSPNWSLVE
ncbi:hypothetical protein RB653_001200 [Dictyostelium firmibasis]|uniref:C-CAP/cofactor C-like domain-containing protein n=1 Tax=Dictyostelium firmibasis TaxID=79012 RepID=A0AAN7U3W5_9MYCE